MPDTRIIVNVKGTEETTALPKQIVRAAISQGQITHSQLIWSPVHKAWKQVRELPHLWPSQKLAPPPPQRMRTTPLPSVEALKEAHKDGAPRLATVDPAQARGAVPQIAATPKPNKITGAFSANPMKWLSILLALPIVFAVVINYFMVDLPLVLNLGKTPFAHVTVYAQLGAYVQPSVIVIHVANSKNVTPANLTQFLVALAHSTPPMPLSQNAFETVALTSGWTGQYTISGYAWAEYGNMGQEDEAQRESFLMDQLRDMADRPLMAPNSDLSQAGQENERRQIWESFVKNFTQP